MAQAPDSSTAGGLSSRVYALLGAARHGPFVAQAKKAVKLLQAPAAHVRCLGIHKLQQLLLQFSDLHKERQVALELLLLVLQHGTLSAAAPDAATDVTIAAVFSQEEQLPCAAFLQPSVAAAAHVQQATAGAAWAAAVATKDGMRLTCRTEALECLLQLIAEGALGWLQLVDALHASLAAANSRSSSSSTEILPPQLQRVLVHGLLDLALQGKLLTHPQRQGQQQHLQQQEQQQHLLHQAAAALGDALVRICHFCPRVCLAAIKAVCGVLEEAACDGSSSNNLSISEAPYGFTSAVFDVLLEPTLVLAMQLLLSSSSSSASSCSLIPLAVTRLLQCADMIERAELQRLEQQQEQQQQRGGRSDKLLHLSLSALLRIEDVEEFCCCFSAALQCAQLSAACIASLSSQALKEDEGLLQQQQARMERLLWECLCRLYTAREQQQDPSNLLHHLLRCLELLSPMTLHIPEVHACAAAVFRGVRSSNSNAIPRGTGSSSSVCLSVGMWRVSCALVGWLLWSAAASEANEAEVLLLLQAIRLLLQLQPLLCVAVSSKTDACKTFCSQRAAALRLISSLSPLLLLLLPLVTQQQLGVEGARCAGQLSETMNAVILRVHALLSYAAATAAAAETAAAGDTCCSRDCCFSFEVEDLFGLSGSVGVTIGNSAAMPLSLAAWAFRVLDWGAAQHLLGDKVLREKRQQPAASAAVDAAAAAVAFTPGKQQQQLLHVLLRRERRDDLHSPSFLLSLPSSLLQQGPYAFVVACCFLAEKVADRQQAFAAVSTLVATAPATALLLLPALHFAAFRPPTVPIVHALLRWKTLQQQQQRQQQQLQQQQWQQQQQQQKPLLLDSLVLFDGDEEFAASVLIAVGSPVKPPRVPFASPAAAERWQLLRSISNSFALALQALASLGLHKTAVLPVYRALHDLLPLQQQQQQERQLALLEDEWLCATLDCYGQTGTQGMLCYHRIGKACAEACSRCCCCRECCWCSGDSLAFLATRMRPVFPHQVLSANARWFLLMRSLTRLCSFDELPYTKLAAAAPSAEPQQDRKDHRAAASGEPASTAKLKDADATTAVVPFTLPESASPLQQLLLAYCLQQLEAVCPRALLQFLPAMQQIVSACGFSPALPQQNERQQQQQWVVDITCGMLLSTLGRLCMRRFLESAKILKVLRRKCGFLFDTLRAPPLALNGCVLILYALAQDLAEKIEQDQRMEDEEEREQPQRTDSGLTPELEAQVQELLLLLEEVAESGSQFARSAALRAASLILGPLYAAVAEATERGRLRAPAGECISVRFACSEGIGAVVLHLPLRQLEVRGAAALLAAAMTKERVARGTSNATTLAELQRQQYRQKLGSFLARKARAATAEAAGDTQTERSLLRLLLLSKPKPTGAGGGGRTAHEAGELKKMRMHTLQEARYISRHMATAEPFLLTLLPQLCEYFIRRFVAMLPPAVAADGELLNLGQQLLQQLEVLLPRAAADQHTAAAGSGISSAGVFTADANIGGDTVGLGLRLPEFSVLASILSAIATQQPALTPVILNFFSLRLHGSEAVPPPPWLSSCLLMAFAPLHARSSDVSELWAESLEGQDGSDVFAAILCGTWGPSISSRKIRKCLCGSAPTSTTDLLSTGRCIFLAAHAQRFSGDRARLSSCVNALAAACTSFEKTALLAGECNTRLPPADTAEAAEAQAVVTTGLATAIAEVARVVHLQTPDPTSFYPQLAETHKQLEGVVFSSRASQSSRWNALLALGSLVPILLEARIVLLDEIIYFLQRIEELLQELQPEPSTLAYAGIAHLTHSLLPLLLLLLQRKQRLQLQLRVEQQISELQRLLLHFEGVVQRWLAAPAVGVSAQLARGFAAAALMGAPFILLPPTRVAAAQQTAGASGLICVSLALGDLDLAPGSTAAEQQQQQPLQSRQQLLKQQQHDASGVAVDRLMDWLGGATDNGSLVSFGGPKGDYASRGPGGRGLDLAGSTLLSLLYIQLTSHSAEGSLSSLPEKSLTRLALQQLLLIRDGQELLFSESTHHEASHNPGLATISLAPAAVGAEIAPADKVVVEDEASDVGEEFGFGGLVAVHAPQAERGGGSGLLVTHYTCLLEALACRGVPAFSELQLGRKLVLLFSRSMEDTMVFIADLSAVRGCTYQVPDFRKAGGVYVGAPSTFPSSHALLQKLQACCSLQLGVMRFCCRHCDRLPQFAALMLQFGHAGFGICAAVTQPREQQHQRRRFTDALSHYFLALLPSAAGALRARDLCSLLGGILFRGLLPPAQEPLLWCSALNALRRILESARRGVCCSGKDTQQRKRWEQQQQQQALRPCSQIESEIPYYVFPSVFHKLCLFREIHQLITLWILPLLTGTSALAGGQLSAAPEAAPGASLPRSAMAAAAATAAQKVPFAVWGEAAKALEAYLLLRKDCLMVQAVLYEEDVASLPSTNMQIRRRQHFAKQKEQEERQLMEGLALLPALVVVHLVMSGAAPFELIHRKRRLLLVQPALSRASSTPAPRGRGDATPSAQAGTGVSPAAVASDRDDASNDEDALTSEIAAFCYASSWLPRIQQVELAEAFACSSSSGGCGSISQDLDVSAPRSFVGLVLLAAYMVTPHQASLVLPDVTSADLFGSGCRSSSSRSKRPGSDGFDCNEAASVGTQQGCACQWVQSCGRSGLSLCGEFAAFPAVCADMLEREDSIYSQVAEERFMYTSQQGIKHLVALQHRWNCSSSGSSSNHQCCCCSSCFVGSKHPMRQVVLGSADSAQPGGGCCLEPLLLIPTAFSGARGFYCLNVLPNLYHLASLSSQLTRLHDAAATSETEKNSSSSSVGAANLCNEIAAEYERSVRLLKKAIYGDECYEGIILERRDSLLLQSHLPTPLMMQYASVASHCDLAFQVRTHTSAAAEAFLSLTEALAPCVSRLLHEVARRSASTTTEGAGGTDSEPWGSLRTRMQLLGPRILRILAETRAGRKARARALS